MRRAMSIAVVLAAGCGGAAVRGPGPLRFHNQPPVTVVNDRKPVPEPEAEDTGLVEYYFREDVARPARRAFKVEPSRRAANVNSLGDVPDSAWFTNRTPSPDEVRRGPGTGGPDRSAPWRVVGVKVGGAAIGVTIKDARDDKWLLKFDERGFPESESSADVIVQRLTWAFGYNVPENHVVRFARKDLVLDPEAKFKTKSGRERPMTEQDLESYIRMVESDSGQFRALASRFIDGKILGGIEPEGVREGDANDRVPHELRRDLRGQRVLWAWVNHHDIKSQNSLVAYTDEKYMKWYHLDFGDALGVSWLIGSPARNGYRKFFSARRAALSLVTFGAYVNPWERNPRVPKHRGLGVFDVASFDFDRWVPAHNWRPIDVADRFDELWATEILMRLTPKHIEAAVAAGAYSDRRTAAHLTKTLIARQHAIGRSVFSRVAPLVGFTAREHAGGIEVCFDDLWLQHGYGLSTATRYRAFSFDYAGAVLGREARTGAARGARSCVTGLRAGGARDAYTIVRLQVARGDGWLPPIYVHIARGPAGLRVIGLDRR